ncbi:hypothetical protein BJX99DRAFT_152421 [Aspergillus californicus]
MITRSRPYTRRTGQKERHTGPEAHSKRDVRKQTKTSQDRKTAHGKDIEHDTADKTAIHVTVRCRSRNAWETEEGHAVTLRTDAIRGKTLEVSMGPLSHKT